MNVTAAVGADVVYKLSAFDVEEINQHRADFAAFRRVHRPADYEPGSFPARSGHIGHIGNDVAEGEAYPAKVVRDWGGSVNLRVSLDGTDDYWATSRTQGDEPGQWSWPLSEMAVEVAGTVEHTGPRVGDIVHYVSYGTPGGEYGKECRAAIVTELTRVEVNEKNPAGDGICRPTVGLMVANPTGQFFNRGVLFDDGAETPGDPECLSRVNHGNPFRYCECGWTESAFKGGTWHHADHA